MISLLDDGDTPPASELMASIDNALTGSLVPASKGTVVAVTTPRGGVDVDVDPTIVRDII